MMKQTLLALLMAGAAATAHAGINSPQAAGYAARGTAMYGDANVCGALDQLNQALAGHLLDEGREDLELVRAVSAVRSGATDARELVNTWMAAHPASPLRADMALLAADMLLDSGDIPAAYAAYAAIAPTAVSPALSPGFTFRRAYTDLKMAHYDRALQGFESLRGDRQLANAARFYEGYIAYAQGRYDQARTILESVPSHAMPGSLAPCYLCQIYYRDSDWDKALATARRALETPGTDTALKAEAYRVAGEALYRLGDNGRAIPMLEKYVTLTARPEPSALYILGLAQYNRGEYSRAVTSLTPVTAQNNAMGQNAYLYIGQALMAQGQTAGAVQAFERALNMTHDRDTQEAAYYNFLVARPSGAVPFVSTAGVINDYLRLFPDSRHADEVSRFLADGYLTSDDYDNALATLKAVKSPSAATLDLIQEINYRKGDALVRAGEYRQALQPLTHAVNDARNIKVTNEARLMLAEALYNLGQYDDATAHYRAYVSTPRQNTALNQPTALYGLGYSLFATKDWGGADKAFTDFTNQAQDQPAATRSDAWTRIGDTRYYRKDIAGARTAYGRALSTDATNDFALFQQGMMAGYLNDWQAKANDMTLLLNDMPSSSLAPDAMLELTEAYTALEQPVRAVSTLMDLRDKYPQSGQARTSYLLEAGLTDDIPRQMEIYSQLIKLYPTSAEAIHANETLKRLHAANGTLGEYSDFVSTVADMPLINDTEANELAFNAAEDAYLNRDRTDLLEVYLRDYPRGKFAPLALGYLLEDATREGRDQQAYDLALKLINDWPDHSETVQALALAARTDMQQGRSVDALDRWEKLSNLASQPDQVNEARLGIIQAAQQLGQWDKVLQTASQLLNTAALDNDSRQEAAFAQALALDNTGQHARAIEIWKSLTGGQGLTAAKSTVYAARAMVDTGDNAGAISLTEDFVASGTPHTYWLGRAFITLSDAYRANGKAFEADEYLKALRDNYPGQEPDIFEAIDERLNK